METVEVLKDARAEVADPEDWRGHGEESGACACMAVWVSLKRSGYHFAEISDPDPEVVALDLLLDAAGLSHDPRATTRKQACRWPLYSWNDAPERTHAEVLAAFDRAISAAA